MPLGSSSVSLKTTRRECVALSKSLTSSPSEMSCCTATISARGTITRSIRVSRKPRIFLSMVASSGEKPDCGCSPVKTSSRSARVDATFQPNRMRMTRVSQPSFGSVASGITIGRARFSLSLGSLRTGNCVIIGIQQPGKILEFACALFMRTRLLRKTVGLFGGDRVAPVRVGDFELPQNVAFGLFHFQRIRIALVIVADEMQKTMHGKMGNMMGERLVLAASLTLDRLEGEHDVAEVRCSGP